jgi:hypothetical protein
MQRFEEDEEENKAKDEFRKKLMEVRKKRALEDTIQGDQFKINAAPSGSIS